MRVSLTCGYKDKYLEFSLNKHVKANTRISLKQPVLFNAFNQVWDQMEQEIPKKAVHGPF